MKLITKFILIYLVITSVVLAIGGVISYFIIKDEVNKELKFEFMERIDRVTYLLERGRKFSHRRGSIEGDQNLVIEELNQAAEPRTQVSDTSIWHDRLEQYEQNVKVEAWREIDGNYYYISTYGAMIESNDITEAVAKTLLWILLMQVMGAVGIGYFVSGSLFKPFRQTLERIRNFKLQDRQVLEANETNVKEFRDLNLFVEQMTQKAISDYKNLKEFSENASHELQTPLAIAKGKLELLTETDLSEEQYRYVESLERSIKKLSRLSESLSLLTKIENHEFENNQTVNISWLITESIREFEEFINFNKLTVETDITDDVTIEMHPALAEILWTNIFQNAIKHNVDGGRIRITCTQETLVVSNTGKELSVPPETLFERFRKGDQSSSSIGLGLSIIERIIRQNQLTLKYTTEGTWHNLEIGLTRVIHE
ncbi:MAG: HAMP domain-containing sensor histidine kinase [Balneolaceae bacterium]